MARPAQAGRPGWKLYALLWLAMMALRQDFWNWTDPALVLGFLPVGLVFQGAYSLLAAGVLALLVRYAWPRELERLDELAGGPVAGAPDGPEAPR